MYKLQFTVPEALHRRLILVAIRNRFMWAWRWGPYGAFFRAHYERRA